MSSITQFWKRWVALAALLVSCRAPAMEYSVRRWTAEQGLPQNRANAIRQTHDGYMWFGSWFGLVRFDGMRPTIFDHVNTAELEMDSVSAMEEDPATGTLWIATEGGLVRYKDNHFSHVGGVADLPAWGHAIWLAGHDTVWYLASEPKRLIRVSHGIVKDVVVSQFRNWTTYLGDRGGGDAWFLAEEGVFRVNYTGASCTVIREGDPLPLGAVHTTVRDRKGRLWLGTDHGLYITTSGMGDPRPVLERVNIPDGPSDVAVPVVALGSEGTMWVYVKGRGIFQWSEGKLTPVSGDPDLQKVQIYALLEDREGTVWAGTRTGVVQLRPKHVRVITTEDGLGSDDVWCAQEARDGTLWVSHTGGISTIRNGVVRKMEIGQPFPLPFASVEQRVQVLYPQENGRIWYGPDHLRMIEHGRAQEAPFKFPAAANNPQCMLEDREHRMWFGGDGWVVNWDGTNEPVSIKITESSTSPVTVRVVHQDRQGRIWLGTYGEGLKLLGPTGVKTYMTPGHRRGSELNNRMWTIYEDVDGIFWIGTENGLNRFVPPGVDPKLDAQVDPHRFITYNRGQGLAELVINHILEDDQKNFWLGALHGIYRVSRNELNEIAAGRITATRFVRLSAEDGLLSVETNGERSPSACRTRDGKLWFPTDVGLAVIDPTAIVASTNAPAPLIESVIVDRGVVYGGGEDAGGDLEFAPEPQAGVDVKVPYKLKAGQAKVVRFRYTAPATVGADQMSFSVQLAGLETVPRPMRSERVIYYSNLEPGDYKFLVTVTNGQGVASMAPATFAFSLAPFFWQTWPFYILCGVGILGTGAGIQAMRMRVQRRIDRLENIAALERERSRIAQDLHDELGSGLAQVALLAEMHDPETAVRKRPEDVARDMLKKLDGIVWALNPARAGLENVVDYLVGHAEDFVGATSIHLRLNIPSALPVHHLDAARRHHLLLVFKESLRNAVTHGHANNIAVEIDIETVNGFQRLKVAVRDDGCGFDQQSVDGKRNGLTNMRERAQQVGGTVEIRSRPGQGTEVLFILPMTQPVTERGWRFWGV